MRIINTAELTPSTPQTHNEREWIYNGLDCAVTLEIAETIRPYLDNVTRQTYEFSKALQAPILEMSARGLLVDKNRRIKVLRKFQGQIETLAANLRYLLVEGVGVTITDSPEKPFWRSRTFLHNLLYDVMGLPIQTKRNQAGKWAPTVDREAIEKLATYYIAEPICSHLLALRDLDKKRSWLETEIDADGRMRCNFNIAGTNTGRLASSLSDFGTGTNLQNVDRDLRTVFIADPGMKFGNCDLEQGDSRGLGMICWERFRERFGEKFAGAYLDACESGDLHTTVSRMSRPHLPWTDDAKLNRAIADQKFYRNDSYRDLDKKLGHGSNYVGAPRTMAKHSKVPVSEVEQFQKNYFTAFPCIPEYHKWVKAELERSASLTTIYGRRRFFFGRPNDPKTIREAVAYDPQSTTADTIDTGLLRLWREGKTQLLVQVHDSILFQYREQDEAEVIPWALEQLRVYHTLQGDRRFHIPSEAKVGWNWGDFSATENPEGLMKWKGGDDRKRSSVSSSLSIRAL